MNVSGTIRVSKPRKVDPEMLGFGRLRFSELRRRFRPDIEPARLAWVHSATASASYGCSLAFAPRGAFEPNDGGVLEFVGDATLALFPAGRRCHRLLKRTRHHQREGGHEQRE